MVRGSVLQHCTGRGLYDCVALQSRNTSMIGCEGPTTLSVLASGTWIYTILGLSQIAIQTLLGVLKRERDFASFPAT